MQGVTGIIQDLEENAEGCDVPAMFRVDSNRNEESRRVEYSLNHVQVSVCCGHPHYRAVLEKGKDERIKTF